MWYACDNGRYTVVTTASGLRPSTAGTIAGGRAPPGESPAMPGLIPLERVSAAAEARNLRREHRRRRSCIAGFQRGNTTRGWDKSYGITAGPGLPPRPRKPSRDSHFADGPSPAGAKHETSF